MKKLFFVCMIALLCQGAMAGGQKDLEIKYKLYNLPDGRGIGDAAKGIEDNFFENHTVYYFDGFDFEEYNRNDPSLTELTDYAVGVINGTYQPFGNSKAAEGPYSIIGHSQGGLRALGYLTILKNQYPNDPEKLNDIDAVITVSGIVQGMQALEGGGGNLKWAIQNKVNTVAKGFAAAGGIANLPGDVLFFIKKELITQGVFAVALDIVMACLPQRFFHDVWYDPELKHSPQIRDMMPRSEYIDNNVAVIEKEPGWVKTGTRLVFEWRYTIGKWTKIKWYYPHFEIVDVCKLVINTTKIDPKFDPNVPVGFIAGLNNRTLAMAGENEKGVYTGFKVFEIFFGVMEGAHILKSAGPIGLFSGSPVYAVDADKARKFCRNIDSEIRDIVGIKGEGDGFIALENQYIPPNIVDAKTGERKINVVSDPEGYGYIRMDENNHDNIKRNPKTFEEAAKLIRKGKDNRKEQALLKQTE